VQKDVSINTAIRRLRIALHDDGSAPKFIETVGSRGYRLKVPVEWLPGAAGKKPAGPTRLAVVPFADLNSQTGDFFSDGLTEEIIAHVGPACKNIAVIAPISSWHLKPNSRNLLRVAQQLHADFVLSGTVSRMDSSLRITARLVRSSDQSCVWTESYLRKDENVFGLQKEISDHIAREIAPAFESALPIFPPR
jgi:TolB-like protein